MSAIKIKFSNNSDTEFVDVLREAVNSYFKNTGKSKYGNFNMVVKTIFMFSLYLGPYSVMISGLVTTPLFLLILWCVMGVGAAGVGLSIMHDANHRSYSKHQWVNNLLSCSLNLLGGYSANWRQQHNVMHHSYTNIDGLDEDINPPASIMRFSPGRPLHKIYKYQHIYAWFLYGLMTVTWSVNKDFKQFFRYKKQRIMLDKKKSYTRMFIEIVLSKVLYYAYILVVPMVILPVPWWQVLLFYLTMHFICGFILGVIFQTAHVMPSSKFPTPNKNGDMENNWVIHQLLTTTNYSPKSKFFSWFIGGLNYQIEHHLFPKICHIHYKELSEIVKTTTKNYGLPYNVQKNFIQALGKHAAMLKQLGTEASA